MISSIIKVDKWTRLGFILLLSTVVICQLCEADIESSQISQSTKSKSLMRRLLAKFAIKSKTQHSEHVSSDKTNNHYEQDQNVVMAFRNYLRSDDFCSFKHISTFLDFADGQIKPTNNAKLKNKYKSYIDLLFEACLQQLPIKAERILSKSFKYLQQSWQSSVYQIICNFVYHTSDDKQHDHSEKCILDKRNDNFLTKLELSNDDIFSRHVESYLRKEAEKTTKGIDTIWPELKRAVEGVFYATRNSVIPVNMLFDSKHENQDLAEELEDEAIVSLIDLDLIATRLSMVDVTERDGNFHVKMDMMNTLNFDDSSPYEWTSLQLDLERKYRNKIEALM